MLFNSIGFVFGFLPFVVAGYYLLALTRLAALRRPFMIVATLAFYALGGPQFVPLLLVSVALNYLAAVCIARVRENWRFAAMAAAVIANVAVLGYFKYIEFVLRTLNTLFDSGFTLEKVIFPLGISFFTFQQIGYLVDVSRGRFGPGKPLDYASFVLFFPQLLAGPIVRYEETVRQHREPVSCGRIGQSILIGLVIFSIGLFKKTVIADTLALNAAPVFGGAKVGTPLGWLDSWIGALSYTGQVYFDFSGYSDMAIGAARMFGIVLPLNFHSPLRSTSVVEIWRRWHITLGRWVQSYVFQPLSLSLTRVAIGSGFGAWGALGLGVIVPTMIAMMVVGIWHGAGWTFVLFGLMQGIYMATNEAWAMLRKDARKQRRKAGLPAHGWHRPAAQAATVLAFVVSMVPFGSANLHSAFAMLAAMAGGGDGLAAHAQWPLGVVGALAATAACYIAMFAVPNTQQIMGRFDPVLEWPRWRALETYRGWCQWRMAARWTIAAAIVFFLGVAFISRGTSAFIYFNF
ncbi:MBOAT family O-acyltransferase [Tsuneonella mangrovi]|uniref:MBOAT family O-acyltransferase n=1 Tax=Tsuneonella mangrovi TaxID=1982042 RepID=UPI000BA1F9A9|nr:MBOAT family O-acyltransferase [Tsuneonella mangrovi]